MPHIELVAIRGPQRGRTHVLETPQVTIGGGPREGLDLTGDAAGAQARLERRGTAWTVSPLTPAGIRVNDRLIRTPTPLADGDRLALGDHELLVVLCATPSEAEATTIAAPRVEATTLGAPAPDAAARFCGACGIGLAAADPGPLCGVCILTHPSALEETTALEPVTLAMERPARTPRLAQRVGGTRDRSGRRLGPYQLRARLGSGGMGEVYAARDERTGDLVALKLMRRLMQSERQRARFLQEARVAGLLAHPGIVATLEVGEVDGELYLALEHLAGPDLERQLQHVGPPPAARALDWIQQVCRALDHAHERGVIHRDIKLANVLLTADGRVKVADFGIARALSEAGVRLTATGQSLGTPTSMAPEQMVDVKRVDLRADVYAVGVMLHRLLTGTYPFPTDAGPAAMIAAKLDAPRLAAGLQPELARVLERALASEPEARWSRAGDLADALAGRDG